MKKLLFFVCALMLSVSTVAEARPHHFHRHGGHWGGPVYHYAPRHHHGGNVAAGLAVGLIGGAILNSVFSQPRVVTTTAYSPVTYAPVVPTPTIVSTTTTATTPCYTTSNIVTGATTTHCSSTIITGNPMTSQLWFAN